MNLRPMAISATFALLLAAALTATDAAPSSAENVVATGVGNPSPPCFPDRVVEPTSDLPSTGTRVPVRVKVASVTRIRLDASGDVKAVGTNTGCAPKRSDDFVIESSSAATAISPEIIAAALACTTNDDWEDTTRWHRC
jgi:hypothetical protein